MPLTLSKPPHGIEQPDRRINLMISLTDPAAAKLAQFTEDHLGRKVAIVIGGEAVTEHKVRTRIDGGKLQITRCTDDACAYLLVALQRQQDP